ELARAEEVAAVVELQAGVPVDLDGAGDVTLVVEQDGLVDLDEPDGGVAQVVGAPLRADQNVGRGVPAARACVRHEARLLRTRIVTPCDRPPRHRGSGGQAGEAPPPSGARGGRQGLGYTPRRARLQARSEEPRVGTEGRAGA